jgi:hypothetical protein
MNCPSARHDRETDYVNHGCICEAARNEHRRRRKYRALYMLEHGPMLQPALRSCLQLQALTAIGHSAGDIASHSRILTAGHIRQLRHNPDRRVTPRIAEEVERLYRLLSATPGTNKRAIGQARYRGYLDPLTLEAPVDNEPIIDEIAVERAVKGDRISLSFEEKDEAIRRSLERGLLPNQVSQRLGANVERVRRVQRGEKRGPGGKKKVA